MTTPPPPTLHPGRLLVVDDEIAVQKLVKAVLNRANYDVVTCGGGRDGLRILKEEGEFDCVITDAVMPVMSGYDFVKAVRNSDDLKEMPILMLTRKRERADVKTAVEAGVNDYVLKPIDEHLLLDKVSFYVKKNEGKRHIYECPLVGEQGRAKLSLRCKVTAISESGLTMLSTLPLDDAMGFALDFAIFKEMGIAVPLLKVAQSVSTGDLGPAEDKDFRFQNHVAFVGVPEAELRKIRAWIQKQALARRK